MSEISQVFVRYIDEVVNAGNLDVADELVAQDCVIYRGGLQRAATLLNDPDDRMGMTAESERSKATRQRTARLLRSAAGLGGEHEPLSGLEGMKQAVGALRTAFPDWHHTIKELVVDGDRIAFRLELRTTHEGEFLGVSPTHRTWSTDEVGFATIVDGKMTELFAIADELGFLQQLGWSVSPPAAR